ncbi:TlyA family rRNA (cytidine-2'-O)-methyltransferase [filamentous cyanobacterium CCP5]|nr:TlyA family rRNA (cytidine-2'-O)-methyltransferase [filamentous cyanobacterium CCP5]
MAKQRLDMALVERGLCESRQLAQRLIRAGEVQVDHAVIDKPGTPIPPEATIQVKARPPYVSRGGEKLAQALNAFPISVAGRCCLDGGISTGGFTDCLLQRGAARVYGIDVGYGQVAWSLRQDPRVILRERTNIRHLQPVDLYGAEDLRPDLGVMDLSFISLTKVLGALRSLLLPPHEVILLVKPQFEVGRDRIGKKGVVRHPEDQAEAIAAVLTAATDLGWQYQGLTPSPITGPAGNIEYLLWLSSDDGSDSPDLKSLQSITEAACRSRRSPPEHLPDRAPDD